MQNIVIKRRSGIMSSNTRPYVVIKDSEDIIIARKVELEEPVVFGETVTLENENGKFFIIGYGYMGKKDDPDKPLVKEQPERRKVITRGSPDPKRVLYLLKNFYSFDFAPDQSKYPIYSALSGIVHSIKDFEKSKLMVLAVKDGDIPLGIDTWIGLERIKTQPTFFDSIKTGDSIVVIGYININKDSKSNDESGNPIYDDKINAQAVKILTQIIDAPPMQDRTFLPASQVTSQDIVNEDENAFYSKYPRDLEEDFIDGDFWTRVFNLYQDEIGWATQIINVMRDEMQEWGRRVIYVLVLSQDALSVQDIRLLTGAPMHKIILDVLDIYVEDYGVFVAEMGDPDDKTTYKYKLKRSLKNKNEMKSESDTLSPKALAILNQYFQNKNHYREIAEKIIRVFVSNDMVLLNDLPGIAGTDPNETSHVCEILFRAGELHEPKLGYYRWTG